MLVQVALLREALSTLVASVGLDSHVHPAMVQQVPTPLELFVAATLELADVHKDAFTSGSELLLPDLVVVGPQLLQVLDVVGGQQFVHDVGLSLGETASAQPVLAGVHFLFAFTLKACARRVLSTASVGSMAAVFPHSLTTSVVRFNGGIILEICALTCRCGFELELALEAFLLLGLRVPN